MEWDGMGWNGMEWDGMGWNGMEWDGMGWDGMEWDGMGWDGMGLDGIGLLNEQEDMILDILSLAHQYDFPELESSISDYLKVFVGNKNSS